MNAVLIELGEVFELYVTPLVGYSAAVVVGESVVVELDSCVSANVTKDANATAKDVRILKC